MTLNHDEIRNNVTASWDQFSEGWGKWDSFIMNWMSPVGEKLIEKTTVNDPGTVLDVAAGTGEPGLIIAERFPGSKVTGVDVSAGMLQFANLKANTRNLQNYNTVVGSEDKFPFDKHSFDTIVSRFGIIFFPDLQAGVQNMVELLKPGGTISVAVWGPKALNPWAVTINKVVTQELGLEPPPPKSPGIFRCEETKEVVDVFNSIGLTEVKEDIVTGKFTYESPDQYWLIMTEIAAPIAKALDNADEEKIEYIRTKVLEAATPFINNGEIAFDWQASVITGKKAG